MVEPSFANVDHRAFSAAVTGRVAADRASAAFPEPELARIEGALHRRARPSASTILGGDLRILELAADIDTEAPTASSRAAGRSVKLAVHRLTGWYVGHLAGQVRQLGLATARALRTTAARVDELERRLDAIESVDEPPEGER